MMKIKYRLSKDNVLYRDCDGLRGDFGLTQLLPVDGVWMAIGPFGEVYGQSADRLECARQAALDPRLGRISAAAAR